MSHITKIAVGKSATAIWEYDLMLEGNQVLNGSLDVISAIQTLAIKVTQFSCPFVPDSPFLYRSSRLGSALNILNIFKFSAV
jgi:hypothetical protein